MRSQTAFRLASRPVLRSSSTTTSFPAPNRPSTRWEPMNPAPPVTSTFRMKPVPNKERAPGLGILVLAAVSLWGLLHGGCEVLEGLDRAGLDDLLGGLGREELHLL